MKPQSEDFSTFVSTLLFPCIGVVLSNGLYLAPVPAVYQAVKRGNVGDLNVLPLAFMTVSTICWFAYALSVPNRFIVASNLPGAFAVLLTFVSMLPIMGSDHEALPACQGTLVGGAMATLSLWTFCVFSGAGYAERAQLVGYFASALFVALAASPLSTIRTVLATRSSASIYAPLTLAQCANTLLWTAYGIVAAKDIFVYGPNGVGLALGLVQLGLKIVYPSKES